MRGLDGRVTIDREVNEAPRRWGYHLLGLPYNAGTAEGFPVVRASVSFPGEGYAGAMGWIQLLRYGGGEVRGEVVEVDHPPQLSDAGTPYCYWGICPSFFDAPSTTLEGITWVAEVFLTASPDAVMTRTVQPVCGFRWGYTTTRNPPELLPVEQIGAGGWKTARAALQERYPDWDFLPDWAGEG